MADRIRRPAYQHYPGDEERDTAVKSLSAEAFGVWRRMLNFMHEGQPYGHLTLSSGQLIDAAMLSRLTGYSLPLIRRALKELEAAAVFSKRAEDGVPFSRRMVRDEHNRNARAAGGGKSLEHPNVPRPKEQSNGRYPSGHPSPGSFEGSPSVAVAVSASSALRSNGKRGESSALEAEAGETLAAIRALIRTHDLHGQGHKQYIPRAEVDKLGAAASRAYDVIGGSERVLSARGESLGYLKHEFTKAYLHALRNGSPSESA